MLNVTIIAAGRIRDKFYIDACTEYIKRLSAFCRLTILEIPAANLPDEPSQQQVENALKRESEQILKKIPKGALTVAMCVEGQQLSSEELARELEKSAINGTGSVCFIIGSSFGLSEDVKNHCSLRLSMSKMTFPHTLARVMLLEQLYRALSITAGLKYHK